MIEAVPAGREVRAGAEQDQVVGARADDDLLPADARAGLAADVGRRGLAEVAVAPGRILVQRREALGERHLRDARQRRRVLVELQHLHGVEAVPRGDLGHGRRPGVGREGVRKRDRARPGADGRAVAHARRRVAHARSSTTLGGGRVERQPFGPGDRPDHARRGGGTRGRRPHDLQRLHEHLEPEAAGGAREPARRQDVRRAGGVVADDGRAADEHRAGVAHPREQRLGIADVQLEVLGRERLGARQRLSERSNRLHRDVVISSNKRSDGVGQRGIGAEQERLAVGAVLGLGEQVGGAGLRDRRSRRRSRRPRSGRRAGRSRRGSRRGASPP